MNDSDKSSLQFLKEYQAAYTSISGIQLKEQTEFSDFLTTILKNDEIANKFKQEHNLLSKKDIVNFILNPVKEDDYFSHLGKELIQFNKTEIPFELHNTPIGSLPTKDFNASAIRTPNGKQIIVLNIGSLALLGEVINSYLGAVSNPFCRPTWTFDEAALRIIQWTKAISSGVAEFGLSKTPIFNNPILWRISGTIHTMACIFILSHEFGHFILGHLDDSTTIIKQFSPKINSPSIEFYNRNQKQEFEADLKAVKLTMEWCKKTNNGDYLGAFLSVALVFHLLELIDLLSNNDVEAISHPQPTIRRQLLETHYQHLYDEEIIKDINCLDSFMNKIKQIAKEFQGEVNLKEKPSR